MGKSTKTGNQAVSGIAGTSTTKPTTVVPATAAPAKSTGSSGSSGSTSAKSGSSSASAKSASGSAKTSSGGAAAVPAGPTIAQQLYAAYSGGVAADPSLVTVGKDGVTVSGSLPAAQSAPGNPYQADTARQAAAVREITERAAAALPKAETEKLNSIDITELQKQLQELAEAQTKQAVGTIDNAVQNGSEELRRAYGDALPQFQEQRNAIAAAEANALDNQVLYAARRGDSGGVGQAQYGAIQNTAARNQTAVNAAQVQLYTDTTRQIADLRNRGEFEKADKVLEISQEYTGKLMDLEKWAKEKNVGIDEFNAKLEQWKAEYDRDAAKFLTETELNAAKLAGALPNGAPTAEAVNDLAERYAAAGKAMIGAGIIPSTQQLAAMGWTPEAYQIYRMQNATY